MKRNSLLAGALFVALSLTAAPVSGLAAGYDLGATVNPDHVTLTWSQDPATTQTITWRTDVSVSAGIVQYAKEADKAAFPSNAVTANETAAKFTTDAGDINIHSITLTGLEPGTKYVYRVGDGTNWSDSFTFSTQAKDTTKFKFLIFGDSQSGDSKNPEYGPWKTNVQSAYKANPDAKFFVNVGDLVETGQYYIHWNNWFDATKGVIENIPEMAVQGNHETYIPNALGSVKPIFWTTQFKLFQNGPDGLKDQTYSYDYGNVHIVVLDSQEDEEKAINGSILDVQKTWLENDLKNTDKPWKLVFFHKTPYYNKATRTNEAIKAAFSPIFDKYHVDVVFNGHDHGISRTYPINNDTFVDSISKGTVYYVTGRSGNKYYTDLSQKVWDAFFYDPQDQPNYITAEVDGNKLTLKAVKADGTLIDNYVMDKDAAKDYPSTVIPPKYNNTRMAIYGNMLQQPVVPADPKLLDGKWYVPAKAFVQFLGGSVQWSNDRSVTLNIGKTTAKVSIDHTAAKLSGKDADLPDKVLLVNDLTYISADDLQSLFGFTYKYDSSTNIIFFAK
jgi:hypothetical protein